MACGTINIFLTSFAGLSLPPTLSLPTSATTSIKDLRQQIADRLPQCNSRYILTTSSNKTLSTLSDLPIRSLISNEDDTFLPLRLTVPLRGGKGGFGSQLRAAGGRMSSKRKKTQGGANSSNRNLDGRRLRTVNEAKALAEYLALKPDMDKKEKESRRKRWEQVVELTEKKEGELRNGSKGRVNGQWVEDKEEAGDRARAAVLDAIDSGQYHDNLGEISHSPSRSRWESRENELDEHLSAYGDQSSALMPPSLPSRMFEDFNDDSEFMSSSEEDDKVVGVIDIGSKKGKEKVC